jgi:hypothetical protein
LRNVPTPSIGTRSHLTSFTTAAREFMLSRHCWRIARASVTSSL